MSRTMSDQDLHAARWLASITFSVRVDSQRMLPSRGRCLTKFATEIGQTEEARCRRSARRPETSW
jgi:hypothetical protein